MRINQFLAKNTALSRRGADQAIKAGRVQIDSKPAVLGDNVTIQSIVTLDGTVVTNRTSTETIMLNKPVGYVCSRNGQGSKTIYELFPEDYQNLQCVGRLDKNSSGLLLLTNDGQLAQQLTHPSFNKKKLYIVSLDKPMGKEDRAKIEKGVQLDDGISRLRLDGESKNWVITLSEGRNRQIRRTFEALNYNVIGLHRVQFGSYKLNTLGTGKIRQIVVK